MYKVSETLKIGEGEVEVSETLVDKKEGGGL
jgi:hypothetical protein